VDISGAGVVALCVAQCLFAQSSPLEQPLATDECLHVHGVSALHTRRQLLRELRVQLGRAPEVAGKVMEVRRRRAPPDRVPGVSLTARSAGSAAAAVAPRAAAFATAESSSAATVSSVPSLASARWRACCSTSLTFRASAPWTSRLCHGVALS
jgi:hypothetical protein